MTGISFFQVELYGKLLELLKDRLTTRLNRIENLLVEERRRKIENVEARMKTLEDAPAV